MASALAGRKLAYRRSGARGLSVKGDVGFEPLEVASQWLAKIRQAATDPDLLPALPAYAFAQTIMAHPFSDGNGRAARVMVHAALARCVGLELPVVALAPAFYRSADSMASALHMLSDRCDWTEFYLMFLTVLEDAVALIHLFQKRV
jgi:Fic family protein